jgi:hypothetical protein
MRLLVHISIAEQIEIFHARQCLLSRDATKDYPLTKLCNIDNIGNIDLNRVDNRPRAPGPAGFKGLRLAIKIKAFR